MEEIKKYPGSFPVIGATRSSDYFVNSFCTLLKGSHKSGYLFLITLAGLPLSWKWRWKGFAGAVGGLLLLLLVFYPLFPPQERLWQIGAAFSLGLGLFTTFMGFEEIKNILLKLHLESQSRLDNLIDLDEKFNISQETWKYEEAELQNGLEKKTESLKREQEELNSLEKMSAALRTELERQQTTNQVLLEEVENKAREISGLEQSSLKTSEHSKTVERKLEQSQGDRENTILRDLELLKGNLQQKEEQIALLNDRLHDGHQQQIDLDDKVAKKEKAFLNMQEALRQKISSIQELHEKLHLREQDLKKQKDEINGLLQAVNQKEHEVLTIKSGLNERDFQIQKLNQKLRDTTQDLTVVRSKIEEKELEMEKIELKSGHVLSNLENALKTSEIQLKRHTEELEGLKNDLERKEAQSDSLAQDLGRKESQLASLTEDLENKESQIDALSQDLGRKESEVESLTEDKDSLVEQYECRLIEVEDARSKEDELVGRQFDELKKLNDTRFALYQASLDKERLKKAIVSPSETPKHWLLQVEQLLKGDRSKRFDFAAFPKELSRDLLTLNQTKALYKQLRTQFDEKHEALEEARRELYKAETEEDKRSKQSEHRNLNESPQERAMEEELSLKAQEIHCMEAEVETLNGLVLMLLKELETAVST